MEKKFYSVGWNIKDQKGPYLDDVKGPFETLEEAKAAVHGTTRGRIFTFGAKGQFKTVATARYDPVHGWEWYTK